MYTVGMLKVIKGSQRLVYIFKTLKKKQEYLKDQNHYSDNRFIR